MSPLLRGFLLAGILAAGPEAAPRDWPAWRFDAARRAASPHDLAATLHLQWVREVAPPRPAWPDQPRMPFDVVPEPVVQNSLMFVPCSATDSVTALDTRTGAERWRFFAEGPVRLAPAAWDGKVYFVSDDGYLYCLEAQRGTLLWKFRGGPSDRKILGNGRLISTWPARGGPVIADGTLYFAAGIWPFMGIFLYALDARTGRVLWVNDGDGSTYMPQPHRADSFAGVAPQGPLVVTEGRLLVPGGRSVPAVYDRATGKLLNFALVQNPKKGGSDVAAQGNLFFCGGSAFEITTGLQVGEVSRQLVLAGDHIWHAGKEGNLLSFRTPEVEFSEGKDKKGKPVRKVRWRKGAVETIGTPPFEVLIRAGSRFYAGGKGEVFAIDPAARQVCWRSPVEGTVGSLLAADDRLFAVTLEGRIYCFGADRTGPRIHRREPVPSVSPDPWTVRARSILETTGVREGYGVVWGAGTGRLAAELARQSDFRLVVVEADPAKVETLRRRLVGEGLYGERVAVLTGDPRTVELPPYLASLMVSEELPPGVDGGKIFPSLRPYGGVACLSVPPERRGAFRGVPGAEVREAGEFILLRRPGPPPGAADWTHEHADAANTRVSRDSIVKAPLGLLWFGGPSHEGILPRHGHGPQPQVCGGRLFIEGMDLIRAIDIYTGRLLWEAPLPGVGRFYDNTLHQPGANAAGSNFVSTPDVLYVAYGRSCVRLDPATGKKMGEFSLPAPPGRRDPPVWGYIGVSDRYLVGGEDPLLEAGPVARGGPKEGDDPDPDEEEDEILDRKLAALKGANDNFSSSRALVVLDRHTGSVLWRKEARAGFRHNAVCIGGGRLYVIDRHSGPQLERRKNRGEIPSVPPRLVALDLRTGREVWSTEKSVFGTWLGYSEEYDVLIESGRRTRDALNDEPKGMRAYRGSDGSVLWEKGHVGPPMIHGRTLLTEGRGYDLLTGDPRKRVHPLTGLTSDWIWSRNYGCNTPMASQHLLTFRSGAAGYFDLLHDGGTGNFGGFKSGCSNNLVVAGGVLCAPDYTRTCTCSYQNQTSLALVPMPEAEMWTFLGTKEINGPIRRMGLNLGAPGDRRAEDGTLWLEVPSAGGASPAPSVSLVPERPDWFRRHSSRVEGRLNWVGASGARGLTSLRVTLDKDGTVERTYTVRLVFAEPGPIRPGERMFHVGLQGRQVLHRLDVVREAGGPCRTLLREFKGIAVKGDLEVTLVPVVGETLLCGIEILAEKP